MARVPYVDPEAVPSKYRALMNPTNPHLDQSGGGGDDGWNDIEKPRNTHRALANNPPILDAYRRFGAAVWQDSGLGPVQRELVILAVARTLDSAYEWHQHAQIALSTGVPEADLLALADWNLDHFDDETRALLQYVEAFVDETVDDETHDELMAHFDASTLVGITQLAGYYAAIHKMGEALALDFEEDFIGWQLDNR